jgi:hypothetical protein
VVAFIPAHLEAIDFNRVQQIDLLALGADEWPRQNPETLKSRDFIGLA